FRLQLKEKTWKGLVEHALDGWNIGPAPYGYTADRIPHPVPAKASQGRTKTRLATDPQRAPWWSRSSPGGWCTNPACPPSPPGSTPTRPATPPPPARAGPPRPCSRYWATRSTPGTWSTAGSAPATAAASPSRPRNGSGLLSRSTPRSWTGPPGKL